MNTERLKTLIDSLLMKESRHNIQDILGALKDSLSSLSGSPGDPNVQNAVAGGMESIAEAMSRFYADMAPNEKTLVKQIKAERYFTPNLTDYLRRAVADNAMTPAVVSQMANKLHSSRAKFLENLRQATSSLDGLGIRAAPLEAGEAEMDILIPRALFDNRLDALAKELGVINRIIDTFSEVSTGEVQPVEVQQISTTDPIFSLTFSPVAMVTIAGAITWLLNTWKQSLEIKELRQKTKESGMFSEKDLKIFDDKIEQMVDKNISSHIKELLENRASDPARDNELKGWLKWSMRELLGRIERGLVVEIRSLPPPAEANEDNEAGPNTAFDQLAALAPDMTYPPPTGEPILKIGLELPDAANDHKGQPPKA